MVNRNRIVDEEGFMTVARNNNGSRIIKDGEVNGGRRLEMLSKGKSVRVEKKIIGGSMGKKGSIWSGIHRRFCWLTFRAGVWLSRMLKKEAKGGILGKKKTGCVLFGRKMRRDSLSDCWYLTTEKSRIL